LWPTSQKVWAPLPSPNASSLFELLLNVRKCSGVSRRRHQITEVPNNRGTKEQRCQRAEEEKILVRLCSVATSPVVLRWLCDYHHERDVREEQKYMYVARTSNYRVISSGDLYCCLLPWCEALRICRSEFPIATAANMTRTNRHNAQHQAQYTKQRSKLKHIGVVLQQISKVLKHIGVVLQQISILNCGRVSNATIQPLIKLQNKVIKIINPTNMGSV